MEASALKYQSGLGLQARPPLLRLQSDDRLVALSRRGIQAAFEVLVKRYEGRLLAFCRHLLGSREDAEDVLQEVFAAAYNAMLGDDRPINVRPWLYRIARNRSLNHLRRAQAIGVDSMDVHLADFGTTTADRVHDREEFRLLVGDIHALAETQRTALVLREMDALSYEQIAEAMETTVSSVKSLLVRARVSLAEAAEARALSCEVVRIELGEIAEGLARRPSPLVRRHLKGCVRCDAFRLQLRENNRALGAILPATPLMALKKLLFAHLGHGAGSAGSAGTGMGVAGSGPAAAGSGAVASTAAGGGALAGTAVAGAAAGSLAGAGTAGFASAGFNALATKAVAGLATAALVSAGAVAVETMPRRSPAPAAGQLQAALSPGVTAHPAAPVQHQSSAASPHRARGHHTAGATATAVHTAIATATGPAIASTAPIKPSSTAAGEPKKPASSTSSGTVQEQTVATVLAPPSSPGSAPPSSNSSSSSPSSDSGPSQYSASSSSPSGSSNSTGAGNQTSSGSTSSQSGTLLASAVPAPDAAAGSGSGSSTDTSGSSPATAPEGTLPPVPSRASSAPAPSPSASPEIPSRAPSTSTSASAPSAGPPSRAGDNPGGGDPATSAPPA